MKMQKLLINRGFKTIHNYELGCCEPKKYTVWAKGFDEEGDPEGAFLVELEDNKLGRWVQVNDPHYDFIDLIIKTEEELNAFILLFI